MSESPEKTPPAPLIAADTASAAGKVADAVDVDDGGIPERARGMGAVLQRVAAVVGLTIGEAIRSRFLLAVVALGLLAMLYFSQGEAVSATDQMKLLRHSISQVVVTIATVCTLFLCAFALPSDIETRRIYTLVTKPASRGLVFFGRFLGFAILGGVLLFILGLLGAAVVAIASRHVPPEHRDHVPRVLPTQMTTWGAVDGKPSARRQLPTVILAEAQEAGVSARFTRLKRSAFSADGPVVEMIGTLRMRPGRHIREKELATLTVRNSITDATQQFVVELQNRDPQRVTVPWALFEIPNEPGRVADVDVSLRLDESPYMFVLEPDSLVLLGRAESEWGVLAKTWLAEFGKLAFLVAVVVMFSTVFTPYTAILAGFFTGLAASVAHTLHATVESYGAQLAHAKIVRDRFGRDLEPTMALAYAVFGDPNSSDSLWQPMLWLADRFPSFERFAISADFVAGYAPAAAETMGMAWFFAFWTLVALILGFMAFTLREIA